MKRADLQEGNGSCGYCLLRQGDYVLLVDDGGASRIAVENDNAAIDAVIVGVLDYMNVNKG